MKLIKIVITGGPCAGKSTSLSHIKTVFSKLGYTVLIISETATELISGGISPWSCISQNDYQKCQMKLQIEKEKVYEMAAEYMKTEKVLIVCDRGAIDNKAYMDNDVFDSVMSFLGTTEAKLRDSYDAVFHLVSAAKGAEEFYTTENNTARTETPAEAAALDDKLIEVWAGHPYLRIIDNSTDFENKINRLVSEIKTFLNEK